MVKTMTTMNEEKQEFWEALTRPTVRGVWNCASGNSVNECSRNPTLDSCSCYTGSGWIGSYPDMEDKDDYTKHWEWDGKNR